MKRNNNLWWAKRLIDAVLYSVIIWVVLFLLIYDSAVVYDISMQPTFNADSGVVDTDMVYYNRLAKYHRGDVVIIQQEDDMIIKRVIALHGDRVRYQYDDSVYQLYINDQKVVEDYIKEEITIDKLSNSNNAFQYVDSYDVTGYNPLATLRKNQPNNFDNYGNYIVPEGTIFVMGDNRLHSTDSKTKGGYIVGNVIGVVEMVIKSDDNAITKLLDFVF